MVRRFLYLFVSVPFLVSCSITKRQVGQVVIDTDKDTTISKQAILKIKNLNSDIFDTATYVGEGRIKINYRLFKPKNEQRRSIQKYPLVVVYHGSGRPIGTDNKAQMGVLQKLFASPTIQDNYPAYVLAPQFSTRSSDYLLDTGKNVLYSIPRPCLNVVLQLIDSLKLALNIDNEKIYAVGFSMGGSTVINSLSARPELFAAGISISGIPQFDQIHKLTNTPIWLIHGLNDTENPINSDERFYEESGNKTLFWKLKETAHYNVFTMQILGETLPKWLFKQHKI